MPTTTSKLAKITSTVSALAPEIAVIVKLVQAGFIGFQTVRAFYKTQGHDDETLDAIIVDMDRRIKRWQDADFSK